MKVFFVSLGCDKNLVDSERMLGSLYAAGHTVTDLEEEAEVCVINTCCFIHDAKQESIDTILQFGEKKKDGVLKFLIVTGCLAQRYHEEIAASIPEVDAILGTASYDELTAVINRLASGISENRIVIKDIASAPEKVMERRLSGIEHYSYLKIAEGCDKHCTYCVIPSIRGPYRSAPLEALVEEAKKLAASGINELIVIAQETTIYGTDLYHENRLPMLLKQLCAIEGLDWIRLMYCYPEDITDELIEVIGSEPKLCHYLDIPIQHISDRILKLMGRRTDSREIMSMIDKLRKRIPDIVIRTSLITGFPSETEEEHRELVDFLKSMRLERVGVFTYSKEEGTPAAKMKGQIPERVKKARRKELMTVQQGLVFERNNSLLGQTLKCIVDARLPEDDIYIGRSYMDAPGIDGCVFIRSERELIGGTMVYVRIDGFKDYDLIGTVVENNPE